MPVVIQIYECKYCGITLRNYKECEEHEKVCKLQKERDVYKNKSKELFNDYPITLFYAESLKELEKHLSYGIYGYVDDFDYEEYEYPCFVVIHTYEEFDGTDRDFPTNYINVKNLNDFLVRVDEVKKEIMSEIGL